MRCPCKAAAITTSTRRQPYMKISQALPIGALDWVVLGGSSGWFWLGRCTGVVGRKDEGRRTKGEGQVVLAVRPCGWRGNFPWRLCGAHNNANNHKKARRCGLRAEHELFSGLPEGCLPRCQGCSGCFGMLSMVRQCNCRRAALMLHVAGVIVAVKCRQQSEPPSSSAATAFPI